MNYNKFVLKLLAFLLVAQCSIVLPMDNPLGNNPVVEQPVDAQPEKTNVQKKKVALSPEEDAALTKELEDMVAELNLDDLSSEDDSEIEELLDNIDREQDGNQPEQNDVAKPNPFMPGLENFMPGIEKTTREFEKERERVKYQNTILLGHPECPVALYRRDLMELPFFIADITIAYLFFENIKSKRVDYVYHSLTEDANTYIELLTQIKEIQKTLESPSDNKEEATQKLAEACESLAEKQSYIGNNPFKLEVVMPFLGTILGHQASRYAQEQCIIKRSFAPEAQYAYTQDKDGNYHRFQMEGYFATTTLDDWKNTVNELDNNKYNRNKTDELKAAMRLEANIFHSIFFFGNAPMSSMSAIKGNFINNPNANLMGDQIPDVSEQLDTLDDLLAKGMYKLAGLPNWLYEAKKSRAARFAMEVAILATMTTQIDGVYNATWMEHIGKNIDQLLSLLHAHEATKNLPKEHVEKQAVHKELLEFIQTGNTCASWKDACTKFFFHKTMGRMSVLQRIQAWTTTAIATSLLWKSRSLVKFGFMAAKNNLLPPEAWLIGGVMTAYMSLLLGPITIISAAQVYRDACWIKDKVKNTIKSFFTKKSDDQKTDENPSNTSSVKSNESNTPKEAIA